MKAIKVFGLQIPLVREKRPSLVGTMVKLRGKTPRAGVVTSERWGGWRITIACERGKPQAMAGAKPKTTRNAPDFVTVWRWKIRP